MIKKWREINEFFADGDWHIQQLKKYQNLFNANINNLKQPMLPPCGLGEH